MKTKILRSMWESNPCRLHGNGTLNRSANLPHDILYIKLQQSIAVQVKFTDIKVKKFQSTAATTKCFII